MATVKRIYQLKQHHLLTTPNTKNRKVITAKKARNPSGQVIERSVKDIRTFFLHSNPSPSQVNLKRSEKADNLSTVKNNSVPPTINSQKDQSGETGWKLVKGRCSKQNEFKGFVNNEIVVQTNRFSHLRSTSDTSLSSIDDSIYKGINTNTNTEVISGGQFDPNVDSQTDKIQTNNQSVGLALSSQLKSINRIENLKELSDAEKMASQNPTGKLQVPNGREEIDQSNEDLFQEYEEMTRNAQVMDVQLVVKMFAELKKELKEIKRSNKEAETTRAKDTEEVSKLRLEVSQYKQQMDMITSVVQRMSLINDETDKRLEMLETGSKRRMMVVSGLQTEGKIAKCTQQIEEFISQNLSLDVVITDCFKLGVGVNKPVVITLQTFQEKMDIFQAMEKLRERANKAKRRLDIFFNDFQPPQERERRRREREIYKDNEADQSTKLQMSISRKGLTIEGEQYTKKVEPPDAVKILTYSPEKLKQVCEMKIDKGIVIEHEGSSFVGYSLPTNSYQNINDAYMNLRLKFPQAPSIVCAYIIPGLPRCIHEDFCDDKEHGAGRLLLKTLQENHILNTAVFVVRDQMRGKIGPIRFQLILDAARSAVNVNPYNKYTNGNQYIQEQQELPNQNHDNTNVRKPRGSFQNGRTGRRYHNKGMSRADAENDRAKRRRSNSPTLNAHRWPEYVAQWQYKTPTFNFAPPENMAVEGGLELGDSWPNLSQATARR